MRLNEHDSEKLKEMSDNEVKQFVFNKLKTNHHAKFVIKICRCGQIWVDPNIDIINCIVTNECQDCFDCNPVYVVNGKPQMPYLFKFKH